LWLIYFKNIGKKDMSLMSEIIAIQFLGVLIAPGLVFGLHGGTRKNKDLRIMSD
jgi:hypothetical protein